MPIPNPNRIGDWSESELAKFVQNAVLLDPPALPSSMSLDALSVLGDMDVGGNALVNGIVKGFGGVATTVGTDFPVNPTNGQIHFVRLDVSPFLHEMMVYDEALGHWVSAVPMLWGQGSTTTTPSNNWGAVGTPMVRGQVRHAKKFYEKGLRPQTFFAGQFDWNAASGFGQMRIAIYQWDDGDTGQSRLMARDSNATDGAADASVAATAGNQKKGTNWSDRVLISGASVSHDHWTIIPEHRWAGTSGTIDWFELNFGFRWVR